MKLGYKAARWRTSCMGQYGRSHVTLGTTASGRGPGKSHGEQC